MSDQPAPTPSSTPVPAGPDSVSPAPVPVPVPVPTIQYDDFAKVQLRVATILEAVAHPNADKLLVLQVDLGDGEKRQVCAGIRAWYDPGHAGGQAGRRREEPCPAQAARPGKPRHDPGCHRRGHGQCRGAVAERTGGGRV